MAPRFTVTTHKSICKQACILRVYSHQIADPEYCNSKQLADLGCQSQEFQREGCSQAHTELEKMA